MKTNGKTELAVRQSPRADLDDLRDSLRGLFDWRPFSLRTRRLLDEVAKPAIDVFEHDGTLVVKAEMPGVAPDKLDVSVADGELRISGEREEEKEVREENYYRCERTYGRIYRAVPLPDGCDTEHVEASARDGVVEVVIPRKAASLGKKIEVKSG